MVQRLVYPKDRFEDSPEMENLSCSPAQGLDQSMILRKDTIISIGSRVSLGRIYLIPRILRRNVKLLNASGR